MKFWPFICLFIVSLAVEEPEAISDEERNDEVAQSRERARWIACLSIASSTIEGKNSEIQAIVSSSMHSYESVVQKVAAEILEVCESKISWRLAEDLLAESSSPDLKAFVSQVGIVSTEGFSEDTISFSARQKLLVRRIAEDMKRTDDGFDQPPPVVQEFLDVKKQRYMMYGLCAFLVILCVGVIWTLMSSSPEETNKEKEAKRKKRE